MCWVLGGQGNIMSHSIFGIFSVCIGIFVIVKFQNALGDVFSESYMDSGSIIIFSMSLTLNSQKYWP